MPAPRARPTRARARSASTDPTSMSAGSQAAPRAKTGTPLRTKRNTCPPSGSAPRSRAMVRSPTRSVARSRIFPPASSVIVTSCRTGLPRSCVHHSSASGTVTVPCAWPFETGSSMLLRRPDGAVSSTRAVSWASVANWSASTSTPTVAEPSASIASVRMWCPVSAAAFSTRSSTGRQMPIDGTRGPKSQPHENVALRRREASACCVVMTPPSDFAGASSSVMNSANKAANRSWSAAAGAGTVRP